MATGSAGSADARHHGRRDSLNHVPFTIVGVEPQVLSAPKSGGRRTSASPFEPRSRSTGSRRIWNDAFSTWIYMMGRLDRASRSSRRRGNLDRSSRQVNA